MYILFSTFIICYSLRRCSSNNIRIRCTCRRTCICNYKTFKPSAKIAKSSATAIAFAFWTFVTPTDTQESKRADTNANDTILRHERIQKRRTNLIILKTNHFTLSLLTFFFLIKAKRKYHVFLFTPIHYLSKK